MFIKNRNFLTGGVEMYIKNRNCVQTIFFDK